MLLATFTLERTPLQWAELPANLISWLQSSGAIAALGLFVVFAARASFNFQRLFNFDGRTSKGLVRLGTLCTIVSWAGFGLLALFYVAAALGVRPAEIFLPGSNPSILTPGDLLFAAAGAVALAVVVFPVLRALFVDMSWGRIWALARLSIKESIRNRGVAVFGVMAIIFLFADWFIPYKPEDQVRNYVWVLYWSMFALFLLTAGILGSFSIPADIKNQTIHTVVTKPITKFEIVLGRFLGYGLLLTVSILGIGLLSLTYILRGVTEEATKESFVARVPVYGNLDFINTKGDSVGREWGYRKYISGQHQAGQKKQYAFWQFPDLSEVQPRADGTVRLEFTFDIFRLTKGDEDRDVRATFKFGDGTMPIEVVERQLDEWRRRSVKRRTEMKAAGDVDFNVVKAKIDAELLKEFSVYEEPGVKVTDYHTLFVDVPYALIERLRERAAQQPVGPDGRKPAPMSVYVSIDPDRASSAQMLGVARGDLYILAAERNFYVNFLKGLVGLWFSTLMVLGVAVCCSTYLSGVISFLCTMFLFLAGFFTPSLEQLATNQSIGGGPAEAFSRIIGRNNMVTPLEDSPSTSVIQGIDAVFRWQLRRVMTLIPDANRYDLHPYVANGFDISVGGVLIVDNLIPLIGYLVPWFVLAFYLINYREIANPT